MQITNKAISELSSNVFFHNDITGEDRNTYTCLSDGFRLLIMTSCQMNGLKYNDIVSCHRIYNAKTGRLL